MFNSIVLRMYRTKLNFRGWNTQIAIYRILMMLFIFYILHIFGQPFTCSHEQGKFSLPKKARIANHVIMEYNLHFRKEFLHLVKSKVKADNPRLIKIIQQMLDPPSKTMTKRSRQLFETPQSMDIMRYFGYKEKGFFIEAGALDGERSSNTIWMEEMKGWTGLLVEADPYFYTQLLGKSRKSWSINACLSPQAYPTVMRFKESGGGAGTLVDKDTPAKDRRGKLRKIPCLPLKSLLLALNQTTVDFFSLDVEGFELPILRTVPWGELDVRTLAVEYAHARDGKEAYVTFMQGQGYRVYSDIRIHQPNQTLFVDDFIFVKSKK